MNRILYTLLSLLILTATAYGQSLVITDSTTTSSICFNDGSIHVTASGGTGPYTFTITGGPSYPNITYPIVMPPLSSTFLTIPKGEYTIKVVDAQGHIAFATATVGGTYTFPVLTPTVDANNCIHLAVQGGRPPFRYAISSQGTNTGFGAYQSSNIFCVCTGHYWLRVIDSCSNIFTTTQVNVTISPPSISSLTVFSSATKDTIYTISGGSAPPYTFHLKSGGQSIINSTGRFIIPKSCRPDTVTMIDRCQDTVVSIIDPHALRVSSISNCTTGDALLTIDSEALGPFTITGSNGSLTTHSYVNSFSGLPLHVSYSFTVRDSCGHVVQIALTCDTDRIDTTFFFDVCPFDHALHFKPVSVSLCFPAYITCLNCSPVTIDTILSVPATLFAGLIDTGTGYRVRIRDACGLDYTTGHIPLYGPLSVEAIIISCRDFYVHSEPPVLLPKVHYTLIHTGVFSDSVSMDTAYFYHIAPGTYQVAAVQPFCKADTITVTLPPLGGRCVVPMMDSSCTPGYAVFQEYAVTTETWTLTNTATNISYREHLPASSSGSLLFSNIPVGTYNLVSDSGCSVPYQLLPYHYNVTATFVSQCTGQSTITAAAHPPVSSCNTSQGAFFKLYKDNLYLQNNTSGVFIVSDTGDYVIKLYLSNTTIFNFPANYDTICPLDTFVLHVAVNALPNLVSVQQEVCGHNTANIPYQIFGGRAPYTVQIIGHPTRTVNGTRDTFPNVYPGIYTMVVSDFCGISKSFSVAVVDTCSANCVTQSHFTLADSIICRNARVQTNNQSFAASHYRWLLNGATYAYITDTSFTATVPGRYTVTLYAYIGTCKDSTKRQFVVEDTVKSSSISDTFLCLPATLKLNTHYAHTTWSTGATDSVVSLSTQGTYWAQVSNTCGTRRDSFTLGGKQSPLFDLSTPRDFLCSDEPDSTIIIAALRDSSGSKVTFVWSTGLVDSPMYSSQVVVYHDTVYHVRVVDVFCPQKKDITIRPSSCDSSCLHNMAVPNAFSPNGDNHNDTFYILHICQFDPFQMHIYNQWGEKVFNSTDIEQGWDGNYKGQPQPAGIYWYWLSLSLEGKAPAFKSGTVTLMR